MLTWARTSCFPSKNLGAATAWAREVAAHVMKKTGNEIKVEVALSGNPYRIRWVGETESMAAHEQAFNKVMSDSKYMELLAKAADLFIPGTTTDEFWRSL